MRMSGLLGSRCGVDTNEYEHQEDASRSFYSLVCSFTALLTILENLGGLVRQKRRRARTSIGYKCTSPTSSADPGRAIPPHSQVLVPRQKSHLVLVRSSGASE